jgi:hypothetical protein
MKLKQMFVSLCCGLLRNGIFCLYLRRQKAVPQPHNLLSENRKIELSGTMRYGEFLKLLKTVSFLEITVQHWVKK